MPFREGKQRHRFLPNEKSDGSDTLCRQGRGIRVQRISILLEFTGKLFLFRTHKPSLEQGKYFSGIHCMKINFIKFSSRRIKELGDIIYQFQISFQNSEQFQN